MPLYDWSAIEMESLNPQMTRQVIHAQNVTLANIRLKKGAVVPEHSHVHEQVTILMKGQLRLIYRDHEQIVNAGQMIETPPEVPHGLEALEDSAAIEVFAPRRDDWIQGEDQLKGEARNGRDADRSSRVNGG